MLAHCYRLRSKDVRFLTRKRQYFGTGLFGFFFLRQYPNLQKNQISFHVSIKYSKRATQRNKLKRLVMNYLRDTDATKTQIGNGYWKIFIVLNKNKLEGLGDITRQGRILDFQTAFNSLQSNLGSKK
ncbi:hypothetical protein AGMMS50249_3550 [candidate division SR1 bacterium]|nr:hypothetical protein AGMMS50249_3550 [candidate division SR1 bacterium]